MNSKLTPSLPVEEVLAHMTEAQQLAARASELGEVPVGAVVVNAGKIIGRGFNQVESLQDATAHAELLALRQAATTIGHWRLTNCCLFVSVEPCLMCAGAIALARVSEVFFGCFEPKFGAFGSVLDVRDVMESAGRVQVYSGIKQEESARLLGGFFEARRRIVKPA